MTNLVQLVNQQIIITAVSRAVDFHMMCWLRLPRFPYIQNVFLAGQWKEASRQRELLLAYLQQQSGAGTLLDTRRTRDYDADNLVDQYLNLPDVQVGFQCSL